ncbi:response regulator [Eubacterium aggregans]|uniref:response regulator n=1 Tax=Eubacterium aggregans TaxID=81409 RepID=UPI0023F1BCE2|nr:response regulator [Eubacterium aggregans]MDD4691154.1 response regulator [Eubacterium aggregans]
MRTIFVDDEPWAIRKFQKLCAQIQDIDMIGTFANPREALDFAREHVVDFAVLDIDMPQMSGLTLGKALRALYPEIVLVYVTAHDQFANAALKLKADYFLTKPYSAADIRDVLQRARLLSQRQDKPVFIRTFGTFDIFLHGQPIEFSSAKAKELLAFLVDNKGGFVTTKEAMAVVWEGDGDDALCRTAAMRLRRILKQYGIEEILSENRTGHCVNMEAFDCDDYMLLKGMNRGKWAFSGEYMKQYSWAEVTLSALLKKMDWC